MTDKPLDCIGVPGGLGKHDYHELGGKPYPRWEYEMQFKPEDEPHRLRTAIREYVTDLKALLRYPPSRSRDALADGLLQRLERAIENYSNT